MKAWRKIYVAVAGVGLLAALVVVGALPVPRMLAQSWAVPHWQTAAGGKAEFEVASVKKNVSADPPHSNVGLTNLDEASPNGGLLAAAKFSLAVYIGFAYKLTPSQEQLIALPKWAASEQFDIQARAGGNATRDQMRLMMQALLADRFKLAVHTETRQLPIFGMVLDKPGKTGPQLTRLPEDVPCAAGSAFAPAPAAPKQDDWFAPCAGLGILLVSGHLHAAGSNMTIEEIASHMQVASWPRLDRPVIDRTGLSGKFDFRIEFTPAFNGPAPVPNFQPDESGPTFVEALKEQLGLKLVPQTGPVEVLVIDHVEEPSEN
jgi:bla regulator protein BlaR1